MPRYKKEIIKRVTTNNSGIREKFKEKVSIIEAILEFQRKTEIKINKNEIKLRVFASIFLFLVVFHINLLATK